MGPAKKPQKKTRRRSQRSSRSSAPASLPENPDIPLHLIDRDALEVVRRLKRYDYKAYLVGGCVRDLMLGLAPKDFDVATDAKPEEVRACFRNSRVIGRRFRLAHVFFRGGKIIEVSTFRAQVDANGNGEGDLLVKQDNVFGTEEEDARRRDFTINGLFYDPSTGKIIDHVDGLKDLESRYVRMIGDPDIRLREDPVRIIRAVRFAAKADLELDANLLRSMEEHKEEILRCSKPRLLEETFKLLRGGYAEKCVRVAHETGVIDIIFPDLIELLEADERHELGVYDFLKALDRIARRGPVSDAVVLGAVVFAAILEIQNTVDASKQTHITVEYLSLVAQRIGATKRVTETLRQIFGAQRSFLRGRETNNKQRRRRLSPNVLMRRAYFGDALDLFEIHAIAAGLPMDDVRFWRERAPVERDAPKKPSRSRRGGRRRR